MLAAAAVTSPSPVLSAAWTLIGVITLIFAIRAVAGIMPRRIPPVLARNGVAYGAGVAILAAGLGAGGISLLRPPGLPAPYTLPAAPYPGAPLSNDASAGLVTFTFDDGPDVSTPKIIAELNALHLHGVFFVIGHKVAEHPDIIRAEMANGEVVGNHTWDHRSLTGKGTGIGTGGAPLNQAQVRSELARTQDAVVKAGAPAPTLWRPPYGGVNAADDATARSLGLRIVLDSGDNITDANDWDGLSAAQIAAWIEPRLADGTIVTFHDGLPGGVQAIKALPLIVAWMNAHHLGETADVRPDATGGVVPYIGPPVAPGRNVPKRTPVRAVPDVIPARRGPVWGTSPASRGVSTETGTVPAVHAAGRPTSPHPGNSPASRAKPKPVPSATTPAPSPSTSTPVPVPTTPGPAPAPSTITPAPAPALTTPAADPATAAADPATPSADVSPSPADTGASP